MSNKLREFIIKHIKKITSPKCNDYFSLGKEVDFSHRRILEQYVFFIGEK